MIRKITCREIKKSLARYLAIFSIVALGVGFYAGLKMCKPDMIDTAREFVDGNNLYDYEVVSSYGIDDKSLRLARKANNVVYAEGSVQQDIIIKTNDNEEKVIKAISLPTEINKIQINSGRLPMKADECLIDNHQFSDGCFCIGERIKLSEGNTSKDLKRFKVKTLKIVGTASTPLFLDYERGTTSIGDGKISLFAYVPKTTFDTDIYTQMYVKYRGGEVSFSNEYDEKNSSMENAVNDLAEKINDMRYSSVRKKAQEKLDDSKTEYEKGLNEYNKEKLNVKRKLKKAKRKLQVASNKLLEKKAEVYNTINELVENKTALLDGINQAEDVLSQLETAHQVGQISEEEYIVQKGTVEGEVSQLQENLSAVEAGLIQANTGLSEISKQEIVVEKNIKKLRKNQKKANAELRKAKTKLDDAKDKIDRGQEKIDKLDKGKSYALSRDNNIGYATFEENANIISNIAKIFPLFFFMIATLVCMTTMTRMVDEQRSQIGVLKALGYSNASILGTYLIYSGSAALGGSITGLLIGCNVFPRVIWNAYTMMYDFSDVVNILFHWDVGIACIVFSVASCMGATWISCAGDFKVVPAELIRPKTPKAGKRIFLERIKPIWNRLGFLYKVSFRNIFRYKKRFFMMVIGVSGCTALLIAGLGINTTIKGVARNQYENVILYDYQLAFGSNMSVVKQEDFTKFAERKKVRINDMIFVHSSNVDLEYNGSVHNVSLTATDDKRLSEFVNLSDDKEPIKYPGRGEIAVCRKLQKQCGMNVGDRVTIKDGYNKMVAKVSAVYDNYLMETIYMTEETYEDGMGKVPEIKTAYFNAAQNMDNNDLRAISTELGKYDNVVQSSINQDFVDRVDDMMKSLNAVVYVVILCAGLLAFIVLYNLTNINITERIREIATIKVLGFNSYETSRYVFRENVFLTLISAVIGVPLGELLLKFVIDNININMIFFVPVIKKTDYLLAIVLTFIFALIVDIAMRKRLANISMTESLKSIE